MTYSNAVAILQMQDRNLRKINGMRFIEGKYEYRLTYRGGFTSYIAIDYREVGKRNFKYFGGVEAYHCGTLAEAYELVKEKIARKTS